MVVEERTGGWGMYELEWVNRIWTWGWKSGHRDGRAEVRTGEWTRPQESGHEYRTPNVQWIGLFVVNTRAIHGGRI